MSCGSRIFREIASDSSVKMTENWQKNVVFCTIINLYTVWKFQDFCITEILREINFVASRRAKTAIL